MAEEKKDKLFEDAIKQVKDDVEKKISELKENVFLTVGISLVIGFFTGIIFSLTGKHCGKKK